MPLRVKTGTTFPEVPVVRVKDGSNYRDAQAIYQKKDGRFYLVHTHANFPTIGSFTGSRRSLLATAPTVGNFTLSWSGLPNNCNYSLKIRGASGNIIGPIYNDNTEPGNTLGASRAVPIPATTTTYELIVNNQAGTTRDEFVFWRNTPLAITGMEAQNRGQVPSRFIILQRMRLVATVTGDPAPSSLTLSANPRYPSNHHFGDVLRRLQGTSFSDRFSVSLSGAGTNSRLVTYTLTATNAAGDSTSASSSFDWGTGA